MDAYEGWAEVYDVWVGTTDDVGFFVEEAVQDGGPLVELGVGNGRVAIPVAEAGIEVIGVDNSPSMLAIGCKRAADAGVAHLISWIEADMRTFRLPHPVQLIMIPQRAFLHLLTTQDQLNALARMRDALGPGGRLIINTFLPRPDLMAALDGVRMHKGSWTAEDGTHRELDEVLTHDAATQRVHIRGIVETPDGVGGLTTELRWIGRYEMEHLLARSGFEIEALFGWFDRRPVDETSTELIWVARKP